MNHDLRPHITLVLEEYQTLTSRLPRAAWEPWVHLMAEAMRNAELQGIPKGEKSHRMLQLELWMVTSNAVDGWKTEQLVKGMAGEQAPKTMPAAAFITTTGGIPEEEKTKRRGLLERVRR